MRDNEGYTCLGRNGHTKLAQSRDMGREIWYNQGANCGDWPCESPARAPARRQEMEAVSVKEYTRRREAWYAWLEDDTHKQTQFQLRKGESFCCLGGACEVYKAETGEGEWLEREIQNGEWNFQAKGIINSAELPASVKSWLGMSSAVGTFDQSKPSAAVVETLVEAYNPQCELVSLNDHFGWTFKQIAAFCRTNPAGLWEEGTY